MHTGSRRAVVTGGASGIGRAIAGALARDGFAIDILDRDSSGAKQTIAEVNDLAMDATWYEVDLADADSTVASARRVLETSGAPAVLVNNAGIGLSKDIPSTTLSEWHRVMSVNLTAPFLMCREQLPAMVEAGGGSIVNIASIAGLVGVPGIPAYCASKGGLIALTRAVAVEHARDGIRCNAVCPGTTLTPLVEKQITDAPDPEALRSAKASRQLDGRMGTPEEIAAGVAFLVSPGGRFMNGSAVVMDGGWTAV